MNDDKVTPLFADQAVPMTARIPGPTPEQMLTGTVNDFGEGGEYADDPPTAAVLVLAWPDGTTTLHTSAVTVTEAIGLLHLAAARYSQGR